MAKLANFSRYRDKVVVPRGQTIRYKAGQGYYTVPKPKGTVVRPGTQQARTVIETPAQIEARVKRMAQEQFNREKSLFDTEAEKMRRDAEGRRQDMIDAYAAASKANAAMGGQVQAGWNLAGQTIQGLGQTGAGTVSDALRADLATQDQALARLGAATGSTGFDPTSQAGVESYRGGYLPAELMTRMGGVANEALLRSAQNLAERGLEEAQVGYNVDEADIRAKTFEALKGFSENRMKYESDYREQLLGARQGQIDAINDANKILADVRSDQAKLRQQYLIAKMNADTKMELAQVEAIYKTESNRLKGMANAALINQRNASANLSKVKADDLIANPGGSSKNKPPSPSTVSNTVVRATAAGNAAVETVFDNIWKKAGGDDPPAGWDEEKDGVWESSPQLKARQKYYLAQRQKSFGTIMLRTISAISPHLKALKYTPFQIKKAAYQIVSAKVQPPPWWTTANKSFLGQLAGKK
jgi:hypothetical protein